MVLIMYDQHAPNVGSLATYDRPAVTRRRFRIRQLHFGTSQYRRGREQGRTGQIGDREAVSDEIAVGSRVLDNTIECLLGSFVHRANEVGIAESHVDYEFATYQRIERTIEEPLGKRSVCRKHRREIARCREKGMKYTAAYRRPDLFIKL
jgi:hypothetical protein